LKRIYFRLFSTSYRVYLWSEALHYSANLLQIQLCSPSRRIRHDYPYVRTMFNTAFSTRNSFRDSVPSNSRGGVVAAPFEHRICAFPTSAYSPPLVSADVEPRPRKQLVILQRATSSFLINQTIRLYRPQHLGSVHCLSGSAPTTPCSQKCTYDQ
jgi:hypothetical protein